MAFNKTISRGRKKTDIDKHQKALHLFLCFFLGRSLSHSLHLCVSFFVDANEWVSACECAKVKKIRILPDLGIEKKAYRKLSSGEKNGIHLKQSTNKWIKVSANEKNQDNSLRARTHSHAHIHPIEMFKQIFLQHSKREHCFYLHGIVIWSVILLRWVNSYLLKPSAARHWLNTHSKVGWMMWTSLVTTSHGMV